MKINKKANKYAAFSIIEVMIALFMFTTAIVLAAGMMTSGMLKSINQRNENIAGQLAQEGIELVRNIRDNNWLDPSLVPMDAFKGIDSGDWIIDYDTHRKLNTKATASNTKLYLSGSSLYSHSASASTIFQRKINIDDSASTQRVVTSMVIWDSPSFPSLSKCEATNHCFYVQVTLDANWGSVK